VLRQPKVISIWTLLDGMASMVDKSLAKRQGRNKEKVCNSSVFVELETIREYDLEKLQRAWEGSRGHRRNEAGSCGLCVVAGRQRAASGS